MICPQCSYMMDSLDKECPRCYGKGLPESQASTIIRSSAVHQMSDSPSLLMAFIGFAVPLAGLIIFLADRETKPLKARSAGRGAALGSGFGLVAVPLFFVLLLRAGWNAASYPTGAAGGDDIVHVKSRDSLDYDAILDQGRSLVEAGKFDEIEAQAAQYRKSQEKTVQGFWKLAALYVGVGEVADSASDAQWEDRRAALADWVKQNPRSITAHVALVRCYYQGAYLARGGDWASTVKEDQWKLMRARLDKGAAVLAASTAMRNQCPGWFAAAQRVAFLQGRSNKEFDAITGEGLRLFPGYDDFHFMRTKYLMDRWHGNKGDWQAYASKAANAVSGEAGDALYAKIVWYMESFVTTTTPRELDGFDWPRAKRGFELLRRQSDGFAAASPYARAAWLAGDRETAKTLFQSVLHNHMDGDVWKGRKEFQKARQWALQG